MTSSSFILRYEIIFQGKAATGTIFRLSVKCYQLCVWQWAKFFGCCVWERM